MQLHSLFRVENFEFRKFLFGSKDSFSHYRASELSNLAQGVRIQTEDPVGGIQSNPPCVESMEKKVAKEGDLKNTCTALPKSLVDGCS